MSPHTWAVIRRTLERRTVAPGPYGWRLGWVERIVSRHKSEAAARDRLRALGPAYHGDQLLVRRLTAKERSKG